MRKERGALLFALIFVGACVQVATKEGQQKGKKTASATATAPAQGATAAAAQGQGRCGGGTAACGRGEGHGTAEPACAHAPGAKDDVRTRKLANGTTIQVAGAKLSGAPKVNVSALLATPEKFAGKKIAISGDISAMCHHRRGWFALAAEDKSGRFVRVITTPKFLVPRGVIGKRAEAEGVVEVIEVSGPAARHYAQGHKLGDPNAIKGAVKRVIVRAAGAEFS